MIIVPFGTMNRRNFILGLGTAATLSGAASVTGASISGTADASSNFNVIAENNLNIRRNNEDFTTVGSEIANDTSDQYVNTTVDFVQSGEGTINDTVGSGVENVTGPRLTVNDQEDSNLEMALATPNDASVEANLNVSEGSDSDTPYSDDGGTPPLRIVNNGGQAKTISAEYTYGNTATGSTTSLEEADVAQLFTFSINQNPGGNINNPGQISPGTDLPTSSGDESTNGPFQAEIPAGEETTVDFVINFSSSLEEKIANAASGSDYDFKTDAFASLDLLEQVSFGEVQP